VSGKQPDELSADEAGRPDDRDPHAVGRAGSSRTAIRLWRGDPESRAHRRMEPLTGGWIGVDGPEWIAVMSV
jgi:hypothetical protein